MKNESIGVKLIANERRKQIDKHGFTAEHHVNHPEWYENNQMRNAAASILIPDIVSISPENWDLKWFLNLCYREPKERLIIAGALIASELDRLEQLDSLDLTECIYCEKKFDSENMVEDSADNDYCKECWKEASPLLKAEYDEMVKNGEIIED